MPWDIDANLSRSMSRGFPCALTASAYAASASFHSAPAVLLHRSIQVGAGGKVGGGGGRRQCELEKVKHMIIHSHGC